ncbi:MAG: hypothetical protein FJ029_06870 [Actinobacteria bacterium]|nr:hypothetical protein [Actinomycetota bacterium]
MHELLLSYGRIEELVGAPLPHRAKVDPPWWTGHSEGSIRLLVEKAGWHVDGVNRVLSPVRFTRAPLAH